MAEVDSPPLLTRCLAEGMGATIKPMAAIHALGDTPERWRALRIADAAMTRTNYLYSRPPSKRSHCAAVVCDALGHVVRDLVESGAWQGVELSEAIPPASEAGQAEPAIAAG